jgi:hypothetical protein
VTSVDFQPGDDIQRAYFDPDCDSEDPYNQVDVSNMFQSMDDPVRWETCEPVQDADAEPEADAEPAEQTDPVIEIGMTAIETMPDNCAFN